ncbi:MAG TPA: membrane protein insertase YidC [Kofleriaceae bacterium]|nr:membrane protein insertase YidC [Kofleriaceae bacterium]
MENQGKRLLLAVAIALLVMLGWNLIFPPKKEEPPTPTPAGQVAPVAETPPAPGVTPAPGAGASAKPSERPAESVITLPFPGRFTAAFSSYGGALKSWKLADPRFERDATHGEMLPGDDHPGTGAFLVCVLDTECELTRPEVWKGEKLSDRSVQYTYSSPRYDLVKTFTVFPDEYLVKMQVRVTAKQDIPAQQRVAVVVYAEQDPKADASGSRQVAARVWQSSTMRGGSLYHTPIMEVVKAPRWEDDVQWTGFEHPYLLAGYAPLRAETDRIEKKTWAGSALGPGADDLVRTDILFPPTVLKPGNQVTHEVVGYLGPKNYHELESADAAAGFSTGFTHTIDFGWFGVIGRPLLWLLQKFYAVVGNWGIAIIMLTILVKLATLYWTTKSMRSMKAMAALAPQMKLLQEKYKDDRQRLQVETMALYKQHNVNPIAGCLPILLQMPIWIALYRMLSNAGQLYQEPFLPGWIDDLTNTDPYHILPVVLVVTMFVQARLQPATGDSRQQKFLQYGMPLMFGVMSFFFPSGLTLYIFTNTVLSALHSIYMNKYDKKSLALVAQMKKNAEAVAASKAAGGKGASNGSAKGSSKNGKPGAAKPIIDVSSTEAAGDEGDGEESPGAGTPSTSGARPQAARPRRKKRRR